jgi:hypothetical protein
MLLQGMRDKTLLHFSAAAFMVPKQLVLAF